MLYEPTSPLHTPVWHYSKKLTCNRRCVFGHREIPCFPYNSSCQPREQCRNHKHFPILHVPVWLGCLHTQQCAELCQLPSSRTSGVGHCSGAPQGRVGGRYQLRAQGQREARSPALASALTLGLFQAPGDAAGCPTPLCMSWQRMEATGIGWAKDPSPGAGISPP